LVVSILTDNCENTPAAWTRRATERAEPWAAAGWSRESQETRFEAILDALQPGAWESMLDYGCGTGALAGYRNGWLSQHPGPWGDGYLGYDWSLGMVERARREHPEAEFTTQLQDGDTWDLIVCCGCFNLRDNWSMAQTWAMLKMLWPRCNRAMAVSLYQGNDPACIRYPGSEIAVTANSLSHKFTIERGYLPNDIMLVVRR
jgi:SAM-dependent methyltransferase